MESGMKKDYAASINIDADPQLVSADDARLAQLGHTQELNRQFSLLTLGWEALSTVIATALLRSGAPCFFYNPYVFFVSEKHPATQLTSAQAYFLSFALCVLRLHLAEEMPNASRNVPIAMIDSVAANGVMGHFYGTMPLFSTSSLALLLETKTGFPFIQIFLDVTKSKAGATVMSVIIIATATAATVAGVTSTSRTLWAFARDRATPFDHYFSKVNKDHQIPVRAVVLITVLQMVLGFIYIGNTTAFNAILSMAIIGMYASYMLPIIYMLVFGRKNLTFSEYGPFKLGPVLGPTLNVVSLIWIVAVK
ncbi:hypothetical protein QQZ08_008310 [Neonectria magnoliae]|uniref:Amino acid permease n=1 Tax=Neonectria magnoliae TaxID=2732573 RepID=A0ABR1HV30_9HYPO